jgi:4-diphosphocytidyl-2-C-methyl-D-erythritol kinase
VPFFLEGGAALAKGIGDILEPIRIPELTLALLLPAEYLGTGEVYGEFDRLAAARSALETPEAFAARCAAAEVQWKGLEQIMAGDAVEPGAVVAAALENDLESASFSLLPGLAARRQALLEAGTLGALMSGSGPTMFGVCRSPEDADMVCGRLAARGHRALAVRTR